MVPASIFSIWRTERGIRGSRTNSRSTTGSVEARIAPPIKATIQPNPSNRAIGRAPKAMIRAVPGPRIKAGISHRRPNSSICRFIASRKRTRERVRVATTSRIGS